MRSMENPSIFPTKIWRQKSMKILEELQEHQSQLKDSSVMKARLFRLKKDESIDNDKQ